MYIWDIVRYFFDLNKKGVDHIKQWDEGGDNQWRQVEIHCTDPQLMLIWKELLKDFLQ